MSQQGERGREGGAIHKHTHTDTNTHTHTQTYTYTPAKTQGATGERPTIKS